MGSEAVETTPFHRCQEHLPKGNYRFFLTDHTLKFASAKKIPKFIEVPLSKQDSIYSALIG